MSDIPIKQDETFVSMSDFIFGTLATDDLRLLAIKRAANGLTHNYEINPHDPKPMQPVKIDVIAGPEAPVNDVFIHYTVDGSYPEIGATNTRTIAMMRVDTDWHSLLWGYVRHYNGEIPGQKENSVVRYRISGITVDGRRLWAEDIQGYSSFSYPVDRHRIPQWAQDAVIYHIFMDRFAPNPGRKFSNPERLSGFFGGTLRGVLDKLDYLSALGVSALWLSPIFPSPSHHGYDSTNFRTIEPRLGSKSDLKALVSEMRSRGMRLILDFVPNHTSNKHPFFEAAQANPDSPYRKYYNFSSDSSHYDTFFGVETLPKINNENPAARRYVIDSALFWMNEFGVDGFRLDYAVGPSNDFWTDYYTAVKNANPESLHFGEIVEPPSTLATYEGVLDGALDFNWLQSARRLFAFGSATTADFEQFMSAHESYFAGRNFARFSFLDNHDMNRFLWASRGDTSKLRQAAVCQMTLSAIPVVYYGTEVGLSQLRDVRQGELGILEESRLPMVWDDSRQDIDLLTFYRRLIRLRRDSSALRQGTRSAWLVDPANGRYGYLRRSATETVAVALNVSNTPQTVDLPNVSWRDVFSGTGLSNRVTLEPRGYVIARQG
ncbi:MAG: DUF3459 domain-containing protein [Anaerolinea sp.]|nr:DUF3459 domain-containing protein [Anaerolinea sp.]MCC6974240.1 DUF3459 domain-containing protein [Anaerolineae bacterium]